MTKFDLSVKCVKVNPESSFEQTMMHPSPQCYIPSLKASDSQERRGFMKGFYYIWSWPPSWSTDLDHLNKCLIPPSQGDSIWNLTSIGPVVSVEKLFKYVDRLQTITTEPTHTTNSGQEANSDNLGNFFLIFYTIIVWVYSLELPWWGDSNEYTQHTIPW